ncbi:MAG: serine/threonine-protein phosphatase [Lachnospiraceae bacterium]|nr:serine/threonine-protein phosphatase [Lachnospiraceae bacterium]
MNISASYYSAIGGRENNEDAVTLLESSESVIGVVADGLGGHRDGELASKIAINTINAAIAHQEVSQQVLRKAVALANSRILEDREHTSMKTTLAAVWIDDENALAASVGDTRIYQFREGRIVFQSKDHSVAQMACLAGDITEQEIRTSRERHRLTRALGAQEEVKADVSPLQICTGDALLLCSDGFWEKIWEDSMLLDLQEAASAGEWLKKMRGRIDGQGGTASGDNHSAVAIIIR